MSMIQAADIAHVRFSAPDLGEMRRFLEEFGLICEEHTDGRLYARGRDGRPFIHVTDVGHPRFIGLGLRAGSVDDLHLVAALEKLAVEDSNAPGGGQIVRLEDPDGFIVELVAGQQLSEPDFSPADIPANTARVRERIGRLANPARGPSHVLRIAHCGLGVTDFRRSELWYKERFGFITSDEIEAAPDVVTGAFLRCDQGDRPVDHHTLVFGQFRKGAKLLHVAYEVANWEDLMLGHTHLKMKGRNHVWGIGRHILGGQVFDYWQDPWGNELEHWTDGELLTSSDRPGRVPLSEALSAHWGPPHPSLTGSGS